MEMAFIKLHAWITFSPSRRRIREEVIFSRGSHELPSDDTGFAFSIAVVKYRNSN